MTDTSDIPDEPNNVILQHLIAINSRLDAVDARLMSIDGGQADAQPDEHTNSLSRKRGAMTPAQYKAALGHLGLTQMSAAKFLKISIRTASSYANGGPIPESTAKLLRLMVRLELDPQDVK
jgi:hypothetical protein